VVYVPEALQETWSLCVQFLACKALHLFTLATI
jgi:hypothetical protein